MRQINILLINIFLILYPWGRFFDALVFGQSGPGVKGITTILFAFIILTGVFEGTLFKGLNMVSNRVPLGFFLLLTFVGTLLSESPEKIFSDYINLLFYFLMVFHIVGINISSKQMERAIQILLTSTVVMSVVSLLDFIEIFDVPNMNEGISNIQQGQVVVFDLTGPFRIRTEISFHLALVIVLPIIFLTRKVSVLRIFYYASCFVVLLVTSFFTNSRSIFLSLIVGVVYFFLAVSSELPRTRNLSRISLFSIMFVVLFFNQSILEFVKASSVLNRQLGGESDLTRWYAFRATVYDVIIRPFGAGLDRPYIGEIGGYKDVHNSYTYLLRSGGFIGFGGLLLFFQPIIRKLMFMKISNMESILFIPVLSLMVFGIFHTAIQVSSFWILIGFCISRTISPYRF